MTRYIAFLRAINITGRFVKMDRLRGLFEELGFSNVQTFIASGNVIFASPATDTQLLERQIESHLRVALGFEVATFVRTVSEVAAIAAYKPFAASELDAEGNSLYIAFLPAPPGDDAHQKLMSFRSEIDDFHVHDREVYWLCRKQISDSPFSGAVLEKTVGMPATLRNSTTVRRLAAKYAVR